MNEKILDALMRLFALITDRTDENRSNNARDIVASYLQRLHSANVVEEYLKRFDYYLGERNSKSDNKSGERKKISMNSVKVLKICNQINEELHQKEKFIVLIQLIEYVLIDDIISDTEADFVKTVSETFNISNSDFQNILAFVQNDINKAGNTKDFLLIDNNNDTDENILHICSQEMNGQIRILYIRTIEVLFFVYSGTKHLTLNGRNIIANRSNVFGDGGIITGENIGIIYQSDILNRFLKIEEREHVTFAASNVSFHYKNSENGIHSFSFYLESGTMVGIMGGSGTGKSTLLNVLTGKYPLASGEIYLNGHKISNKDKKPAGIIGLVPQDDLLIEELTVYQNLYYNTCLCLGNLKKEEIEKHVDKVLADLDLTEIKNLKVGNSLNTVISGGQRKRLNIALELVREPSVLFVDEPTSGLSSNDSEVVMQLLKQQAIKGRIVIVNIHQPSSDSFKKFDKLWVMDKGGYIVYNGNPIEAISYFKRMSGYADSAESECPTCGNIDSEQILRIIESKMVNEFGKYTNERKVNPKEWNNLYNRYLAFDADPVLPLPQTDMPNIKFKIPNIWQQFTVFLKRNILSKLANKQYLIITFLESPILAFILGFFTKYINDDGEYIFSENKNLPVFLFMIIVVALFTGLTSAAEEIIRDRKILEREKFLNLSRFSYITNKVLVVFLISAIQSISFILVANQILEIKDMTFNYWFVMFTTACSANILGLIISSALDSVIAIYVLIPFVLVPQMLLGGAMIDFDDLHESVTDKINVPFIGDLMISRWGYEALAVEQFANNEYEKEFFDIDKEKSKDIYLSTYLMSELDNMTTKCIKLYSDNDDERTEYHTILKILKNEIEYLNYRNPEINFELTDDLIPEKFNDMIGNFLLLFLRAQKEYYAEAADEANYRRQQKITELEKIYGKQGLMMFKQDYYNDKLAEIVLNKQALKKIYSSPNYRLIQKKDPIFMEPVSDCGRAHFYAPVKIIKNHRFPTYNFNMVVLWSVSFIFFLLLLFDIPRKFMDIHSKFFNKLKKK
ncbi:MAG: ATP-binding cassette domain-containing protein [Bacteroidales bacterium]|nr:ATP-binding cassette domain-containing protein [Bacteroidales bacterium]